MPNYPLLPDNAPFSAEQKAWLNGWIAGVLSTSQLDASSSQSGTPAADPVPLTILFGSQTGSAEGLAKKLAREAQTRGFAATVLGMDNELGKIAPGYSADLIAVTGNPLADVRVLEHVEWVMARGRIAP